jgi:hypothetical protein
VLGLGDDVTAVAVGGLAVVRAFDAALLVTPVRSPSRSIISCRLFSARSLRVTASRWWRTIMCVPSSVAARVASQINCLRS